MVCSYCYYCVDLHFDILDFQVEGFPSQSPHVFQGEYVILYYIDLNRGERNIFHNCVDKIWEVGQVR